MALQPALLKRIGWEGVKIPAGVDNESDVFESVHGILSRAAVLVVDDVIEGFRRNRNMDAGGPAKIDITLDFENVAPPFQWYWMEATGIVPAEGRIGVAFEAWPQDGGGWRTTALAAMASHGKPVVMPFAYAVYSVTPDGRMNDDIETRLIGEQFLDWDDQRAAALCALVFHPFFDAHGLLHCNNVSLSDDTFPAPDQKRLARRLGQRDRGYRFHTLSIGKPAKPKVSGMSSSGEGMMSLHICRGHYKTYTADRPLFGKLVGRFFVPQHARGDAKAGIVEKDYNVVR